MNNNDKGLFFMDGTPVDIKIIGEHIIIKPNKGNSLSEILEKITKHNLHEEIETGNPAGNEVW